MNVEEKREVLKHIKLGTNEVLYYPYGEGSEPLPLRPISSMELDECFYEALRGAPDNIADYIVKVKLDLIGRDTNINVTNTGYVKLMNFYNTIDYWVVFHAMKDFQDDWFKIKDYTKSEAYPKGFYYVQKMQVIHDIAKFILGASSRPKEVIKELFKDDYGREVAYLVLYMNIPLADIKDITHLQRDYIIYSKTDLPKIIKGEARKKKYIISGQKMTIKQAFEKFR